MRYLVLSDIHANLEALESVLAHAPATDGVLVLGDLVGYGADPNAVIDRVRGLRVVAIIRGNHDKVAAGIDSMLSFNHLARQAIEWTAAALGRENRQWLSALPRGPMMVDDLVEICHGAPFDEDFYIFDELDARRALSETSRPLCLFGHTHVPAAFSLHTRFEVFGPPRGAAFDAALDEGARYLVNCGAVGQPRDGDPRAAFGVLDSEHRQLTVHRVEYDVAAAQAKILAAGLPEVIAQRLEFGR
jgi:diadenosine tetraphosphatase ApaH/serine/threonine PP2A family protein phosphatase